MPREQLKLNYDEVFSNEKESDVPSNAPSDFNSQVEKALIIKGKLDEQKDKVTSEVAGIAPHHLANPSLQPSNLAGWLRLPNMKTAQAARDQKQAEEKALQTLLEKTNNTFNISEAYKLTSKNAENNLNTIIAFKKTELQKIKEKFAPIEAEYKKNQEGYYFLPSWRAQKPEKYELFATRIEKITKDINELTMTHDKIHKAKEDILNWDSLAQHLEANAPLSGMSSFATTPSTEPSSEHAQAILQIMKQVDYS